MDQVPVATNPELDRRRLLGLGLAGGLAAAGSTWAGTVPAAAGTTYNMLTNTASYGNEGNYSDGPELITYAVNNIRGGLWVHDSALGTVENGSYTNPFHRGSDWGYNTRRVRARSRRSFRQNYAVVVRGRTLWYDPLAGQTVDGLRRSVNGGLKILLGHHSNDYNYAVILIRKSGYITIQREYNHEYTTLENVYQPTPIETYRMFNITWYDDTIKVYDRRAADGTGSNDVLLAQTAAGAAPGVVGGVSYDNKPIGLYWDGAGVRVSYLRVWQSA